MNPATRFAVSSFLLASLVILAGCGRQLERMLLPDVAPQVRLSHVRLSPPSRDTYAYQARWSALAAGPKVDHYLYAIDPMSVDRVDATWVRTTATEHVLSFPVATEPKARPAPHVFAIRAVTAGGAMSDPAWFAFTAGNLPPVVQITFPQPSPVFTPLVPPSITIRWTGTDPDGQNTQIPVDYRYRLFGRINRDFPTIPDWIAFVLANPDTLNAIYAPGFAGWDSVPGETTSVHYTNLNPGSTYLFAITAFDEAGDWDPVFSANKNLLQFGVTFAHITGPILRMFNQFFDYTYPHGGYVNDASRTVRVEAPAGQPITVNWVAEPLTGSDIRWYRWVLAPVDLLDETPRTDEATDVHHWSMRSLNTTSAIVGPFTPPPGRPLSQLFYIEVEDSNGLRSLGIVEIVVRTPAATGDLLIVDDTRFRPDFRSTPGQPVDPPAGPWPTAAELDTFLFARGGVPWRDYPPGTVSPPGIFNGYDFDTLGTRGIPGGIPALSLLSQYRHIVWYTDEIAAGNASAPQDPTTPISALRLMNSPGVANTLAAYGLQGGKVWLAGGGAAYATLIAWNKPNTSPLEYTNLEPNPELRPGRFMYDFAHWREGIQILPAVNARKFGTTTFGEGTNRPGRHWPPNPSPPTPPAPPNYALLPANLDPKNISTDPPPPQRQADSFWLRGNYNAEYIHRSTFIREDYNDDPDVTDEYSTMDTLYICRGGTALVNSPVMTYYHGRETQPFVFSGFNFWYWRRTQCIELVDWVLQSVWGLERDPGAPREPGLTRRGPIAASTGRTP
jgi:hypothetical protein